MAFAGTSLSLRTARDTGCDDLKGRPVPEPHVRPATSSDLPAIAAVHTHYVVKTTATFATSVRTPADWIRRFDDKVVNGPHTMLVAEVDGRVAGYVETSRFRPRGAYDRSVETSIYVAPDQVGRGIGRAMYGDLFARLASTDLHRAFAVIALPNDASVLLHERVGFVHRGTLTEAGRKFGQWLDVGYWERSL